MNTSVIPPIASAFAVGDVVEIKIRSLVSTSKGGRARAIAADREERQAWEALISIIGPQRSAASPAIMALHADYRRRFP